MREVVRVVQAICDLVPTGGLRPADRELFTTLVRWREEAAARLKMVMNALNKGDEFQALQLSESEPRLPDFMAHLGLMSHMGLSEEKMWKDYFRQHGFPVPPPLEPMAVQRLHDLYMRGITPESPFYKECIAAMKSGDDDRALTLLRSIVRLTRDTGARAQLELLLKKKVAPQLASLRACLEQGQEDGVLAWLVEFELSGAETILAGDPVFTAAIAAHRTIMSRRSAVEAGRFLEEAAIEAANGNWPNVCAGIARIKRLHSDWGFVFDHAQSAQLAMLERQASEFQRQVELKSKFNQALAALQGYSSRVLQLLKEDGHVSPPDIRKMQDSLAGFTTAAEAFGFPLPLDEQDRLDEIAMLMKERLAGPRLPLRKRVLTLYLPLAMILGGVFWMVHLHGEAQNQLRELEAMHDNRMADAANKLIHMMLQSSAVWMLNLSPEARAKLEALRKWALMELEMMQKVEDEIAALDALITFSENGLTPEEVMKRLAEVREEMKKLAPDYLREMQMKFSGVEGHAAEFFRSMLARNLQQVRKILASLEKLAAGLDFEKPVSEMAALLPVMQARLKEVTPLEHPTVPALQFPDEIIAALARLRGKSDLFEKEIAAFREVKNDVETADTVEAYRQGLENCVKLRFKEALEAAPMLASLPGEEEILARIYFRGDMNIWLTAKQQAVGGFRFSPEVITPDEMQRFIALRNDPNLNDAGPAGKLSRADGLGDALNPVPGMPVVPLIEIMDRVARHSEGDVMVKAYLFQQLGGIIHARGTAWGLHFCPELAARLDNFFTIVGKERIRSGDWSRPGTRKKWQAQFGRFFAAAAEGKPCLDLALSFRDRVASVAAKGLVISGYVDGLGQASFKNNAEEPLEAWGFAEQSTTPITVAYAAGTLQPSAIKTLRKWTPLFSIPMPLKQPGLKQAGR